MPMRDRLARLVQRNLERPSLRERAALLRASAARALRQPAISAPAVFVPAGRGAEAATGDADAETIADAIEKLWPEWAALTEKEWGDNSPEAAQRADVVFERRMALIKAAAALPASSSRAVRYAKALAYAWYEHVGLWAYGRPLAEYGTDGRLVLDIEASLTGAPAWTGEKAATAGEGVEKSASEDGPGCSSADAELIALGQRFDAAYAAWMAVLPASAAAQGRVEAFKVRAVAEGMDEAAALKAAWLQDGVGAAHDAEQEAFDALEPLNRAIMALPAHTVEGLAVKAKSAIPTVWAAGSFDADRALGEHEHWERRGARDLIEACTALARRQTVGGLPSDGPIQKPGEDFPDGSVLYEAITGQLYRGPISEWITYMAQRLYSVAAKEASRQFNQRCADLDTAEYDAVWSDLQRDLRIDALRDLAFRSHEVFQAAEAKRHSGKELPAESTTPDLPDLSKLSILQLRNLYERYVQVSDFWNDALHAPWANDPEGAGQRGPNAAGDLIEAEQTRICDHYLAVVAEISRRTPSEGRFEASWQLETLIRHELMCNGDLREAPDLRAAIAERWSA